jgi:hypothetical protein
MAEAHVLKNTLLEISSCGGLGFRNNRGMFLTLDGNRKVRAGLEAHGSSDIIGLYPMKITPDMVGQTVAVFMAIETKNEKWKRVSGAREEQQQQFISVVKGHGGIGGFVNNSSQVKSIIQERECMI